MAQNTNALTASMQRLETLLTQLEKAEANKSAPILGADSTVLHKLQSENAAMKKRHDAINTKLTKLISSLEQQLEG